MGLVLVEQLVVATYNQASTELHYKMLHIQSEREFYDPLQMRTGCMCAADSKIDLTYAGLQADALA
jgi:hypothetical protein